MFGRKKVQPPAPPPGPPSPPPPAAGGGSGDPHAHPGHQAVLRHLDEREKQEPLIRAQVAGGILFDLFVKILSEQGGRVRIEDLIAALASIGGHFCLTATLAQLGKEGLTPKAAGMMEVQDREGNIYFFGDAPNRLLAESETALLSLVLGAAHAHGAPVSLDMIHEAMKRTAARIGSSDFGNPDLPEPHRPALSPFDWVRHGRKRMSEALDLYEVPPLQRPAAVGFALQRAIAEGRQVLDPLLAARIAVECAVPMAKVDPRRFD
ncbi:MAG TPA: hypothetical protein VF645_14485 [Allosphingosinicella sp.]